MTSKSSQWAASPQLLFSLAEEYRLAALSLEVSHRKRQPLSLAPFRFAAIHAIELYLSAVLLKGGQTPEDILQLRHGLQSRAELAKAMGLVLRQSAFDHLGALDVNREYPAARYGSGDLNAASPVNRLVATLKDVANKTKPIIEAAEPKPRPLPLCR
ncbi:MAG: hypothetical protein KA153_08105 [Hyphomonadaceae bacterium]|nr:hypothetical protein [Hyphomonadaceae bacterium]